MRQLRLMRCECGQCDRLIVTPGIDNKPVHYVRGHFKTVIKVLRGKPVKERTSRERGKLILINVLNKNKCEIDNYLCNGRLQCHHIDKNPFNNNPFNLLLLCDTHHNFADNRNLSLQELKDLKLDFMVSSNKRRYRKNQR